MKPVFIPGRFAARFAGTMILGWVLALPSISQAARIVIDPAHGGSDPGSRAGSVVEKDWNLKFGKAIAKAVQAAGYEPVLLRDKDETLSLERRIERINTTGASVVLVIHADREFSGTRSGAMIVVQPPQGSAALGGLQPWGWMPQGRQRIQVRFAKVLAQSLGLNPAFSTLSDKQGSAGETLSWEGRILCASHVHLRYLAPTSVVLTPMFLTSKEDLRTYADEEALDGFAAKVVKGLQNYFNEGSEENP